MANKWRDLFGEEWPHIVRLGSALSDPEEKKAFWEAVRDKKIADPSYSIYTDFPIESRSQNLADRFVPGILRVIEEKRGVTDHHDYDPPCRLNEHLVRDRPQEHQFILDTIRAGLNMPRTYERWAAIKEIENNPK